MSKNLKNLIIYLPFIVLFFAFSLSLYFTSVSVDKLEVALKNYFFQEISINDKYNKDVLKYDIKNIFQKRMYIFLVEFIFSFIFCIFFSQAIKKTFDKFESLQAKLLKSNEDLKIQLICNPLSKLPNKQAMFDDMSKLNAPKLIIVDIDDFKKMSGYYSQNTMEKMVFAVQDILEVFLKKHEEYDFKLYHIEESQFVLLENFLLDTERYENVVTGLMKRLKSIRVSFEDNKEWAEFNCTIGFSLEETNTYETARIALRDAIEWEKDYTCYIGMLGKEEDIFKKQIQGAHFIKKALEDDRVVPYFQAIYDKDKNVLKHECLVRIVCEDGKVVSPYDFLDISKKIKRYAEIEKSLLQKSFDAIENTKNIISVNLSSRDMINADVRNFITQELSKKNIAKQVIFEILEDERIYSVDRIIDFIKKLKLMGVKIAIDDFGSGYSNYSHVLALEPDYIKIDGTLIKDIDHDNISFSIVSSIVLFARKIGIRTIAEYVHNKEVFDTCKSIGVDEFQGFYLSEPREGFIKS